MGSDSEHEREVRAARNQSMFRAVNEKVRELNSAFATLTDSYAIACECADAGCIETVNISAAAYEEIRANPRRFVTRPGHVLPDIEGVVGEAGDYVVVEKVGRAGEIAVLLETKE